MTKGFTLGVLRSFGVLVLLSGLVIPHSVAQVTLTARTDVGVGQSPAAGVTASFTSNANVKDIAVVNKGSNSISVLLGNHDGTFQPAASYAVGNSPVAITTGSFTSGSTFTDLTAVNQADASVTIWQNDGSGNGTFTNPSTTSVGADCSNPTAISVGFFQSLATIEAAVTCFITSSSSYAVVIMPGTGTGGLNSGTVA